MPKFGLSLWYYLLNACRCGYEGTSYYVRTSSRKPKLSASYLCIHSSPEVITHSTPLSIQADLHTTLTICGSTNQSNASSRTGFEKKVFVLHITELEP